MSWQWRYLDDDGTVLEPEGVPPQWPSQADAESWIGETWRPLLEAGVGQVILLEDEREVYGPMSLRTDPDS